MAEEKDPARFCFGCGSENPRGLGMKFQQKEGRAVAEFTPPAHLQGYPGFVHGGSVTTMLDEAMGWATYGQGLWAMTARMTTRFRRPVPLHEPLTISGWVVRDRGRFLQMRSEMRSAQGRLLADAEATFVRVGERQAEAMRRFYEASLEDDTPKHH